MCSVNVVLHFLSVVIALATQCLSLVFPHSNGHVLDLAKLLPFPEIRLLFLFEPVVVQMCGLLDVANQLFLWRDQHFSRFGLHSHRLHHLGPRVEVQSLRVERRHFGAVQRRLVVHAARVASPFGSLVLGGRCLYALDWVVLELQRPVHGCGAAGWQVSVTHDVGHTSVNVVVVEEVVRGVGSTSRPCPE